ncbi:hypothetical protein GCM10009560_69650 [Nonomuraea longicatena]|uniref:Uncharacterized protein n=2 Tax=Nonomuraea longicatena TaxID=83682 RepID=A0ABP4BFJ0_9ACTN
MQETVKGKHIMFNVKRTLTAAALSTALAGGIFGLGATTTTTAANASAIGSGISANLGPRCVWVQKNGHVKFGHKKNKVTVTKFKHHPFHIKRERGCVKDTHFIY